MKKILFITLFTLFCIVCSSQDKKGVLKFMGIPVDGSKARFGSQLVKKGFKHVAEYDYYEGQFNGQNVSVHVHTNRNLVDRVMVAFPSTSETNVRIAFNNLLSQFEKGGKYIPSMSNEEIPEDEDISYEMTVHSKRYQASFTYIDLEKDMATETVALFEKLYKFLPDNSKKAMDYYISCLSDSAAVDIQEEYEKMQAFIYQDIVENAPDKAELYIKAFLEYVESLADGSVWYMISDLYGKYYIALFYDNLHNKSNGEDL